MTFDEEEEAPVQGRVHHGDSGISPEQQITNLLQRLSDGIQNYWQYYGLGLQNFVESMQFSSEESAQPNYLRATLKVAADQAFGTAVGALGNIPVPGINNLTGGLTAISSAWASESERAQAAAGEVRVRDYVASIRSGISNQQNRMLAVVNDRRRDLILQFTRIHERDPSHGEPGANGAVVGAGGELMNQLERGVQAFVRAIPSVRNFQQRFSRNFVRREGDHHLGSSGRLAGNLYTTLSVIVERGSPDRWSVRRKGSTWTLVTDRPHPDRVADSLANSLSGSEWQVRLPKMVELHVEIRGDDSQASPSGFIRFERDPARFTVRTNGSPDFLREAWQQSVVRDGALSIRGIAGASS